MRACIACVGLLLLGACGPSLRAQLGPVAGLKPVPPDLFPEAPVVYLKRSDVWRLQYERRGSWTEVRRHRIFEVRAEDGLDQGNLLFEGNGELELIDFAGRVRGPDGRVQVFGLDDLQRAPDGKADALPFPNLQVGSIVEWVATWREDGYRLHIDHRPMPSAPTLAEEVTVTGSRHLRWRARTLNTDRKMEIVQGDPWRITWRGGPTPADPKDGAAPPAQDRRPGLEVRIARVVDGSWQHDYAETWESAFRTRALRLMHSDALAGPIDLRIEPCGGRPRCSARRAMAALREAVRWNGKWGGGDLSAGGSAADALAEGYTDAVRMAAILGRLLIDAGVEVRWAFYRAPLRPRVQPAWPTTDGFERLALFLPAQSGLEAPLWLEPTCAVCAPGELTDAARGADAVVLRTEPRVGAEPAVFATLSRMDGRPARPGARVVEVDLTLRPDGAADAAYRVSGEGAYGQWIRTVFQPRFSDDQVRQFLAQAGADEPTGEDITDIEGVHCAPGADGCGWRFRRTLPAFSRPEGARWSLPLGSLLVRARLSEPRTLPLVVDRSMRFTRRIEVPVPAGFTVAERAPTLALDRPDLTATARVTCADGTVRARRDFVRPRGVYAPFDDAERQARFAFEASIQALTVELRAAQPDEDPCGALSASPGSARR
ncbi:MAG: hypothetical protein H6704_13135 [Myxococcales bacterium]|nr:hypothetical protein [Myxococcales bacterium]MCB9537190.1 hypothetical protein [Myxococcales bacterium]